jgi:hypothetical protein
MLLSIDFCSFFSDTQIFVNTEYVDFAELKLFFIFEFNLFLA